MEVENNTRNQMPVIKITKSSDVDSSLYIKSNFCKGCDKEFGSFTELFLHECAIENKHFFACNECDKHFVSPKGLQLHKAYHSKKKRYSCSECQKTFFSLKQLKKHHNAQFSCSVDKQKIATVMSVQNHAQSKPCSKIEIFTCKICEREFNSDPYLKCHMNTHSKEKLYPLKCHSKSYFSPTNLNSDFDKINPYTCKICSVKCTSLLNLKNHLLTHIGDNPYSYKTEFMNKKNFEIHSKTHTDFDKINPYTCKICSMECTSLLNLKNHLLTHIGDNPYSFKTKFMNKKNLEIYSKTRTDHLFVCEVCKKEFLRLSSLRLHQKGHVKRKSYSCKLCRKKYYFISTLKIHLLSHAENRQYSCNICKATFNSAEFLDSHICVIEEEDFESNIPEAKTLEGYVNTKSALNVLNYNKTFSSSEGLKLHICKQADQHFTCGECWKAFPTQEMLKTHLISHSTDKIYTCATCKKSLLTDLQLKYHERLHSLKKHYTCKICSLRCSNSWVYKKHLRMHAEQRLFSYKKCNLPFTSKHALKNHKHFYGNCSDNINTHSKIKLFSCKICKSKVASIDAQKEHLLSHEACTNELDLDSGDKDCTSDICQEMVTSASSLKCHEKTTKTTNSYTCKVCNLEFQDITTFNNHLCSPPYQLVSCEICSLQFPSVSALKSHQLSHENSSDKLDCDSDNRKYSTCDICLKKFMSPFHLMQHAQVHLTSSMYVCEVCKLKFLEFKSFSNHLSSHQKEEFVSCEKCKTQFTSASALKTHQILQKDCYVGKIIPSKGKNSAYNNCNRYISCNICLARFASVDHLKIHKMGHSADQSYTCEVCNLQFENFLFFNSHLGTHTRNELISCKVCQFQVTSINALNLHLRSHTFYELNQTKQS